MGVEGSGTLSLRPQNLTQQCRVEVTGLETKPELNGKFGDIVNYDDETGRYMVLLDSPHIAIALQRRNCMLNENTCVVLGGLTHEQYNGQMACIVTVDRAAGRYTVRCQNGEEIKVKFDKVVC